MRARSRLLLGAALATAGCSGLLGIDTHELASDAEPEVDASSDIPPTEKLDATTSRDGSNLDDAHGSREGAVVPDAMSRAEASMTNDAETATDAPHDGTDALGKSSDADAKAPFDGSPDDAPLEAAGPWDGSIAPDFSCPAAIDPEENWLLAQPAPIDWDDTFGGKAYTFMTPATVCNATATHWVQTGVPVNQSIAIYVDESPFDSQLVSGDSYNATLAVTGTAPGALLRLDVWDGAGGQGVGDNLTAPQGVSPRAATVFTQTFVEGTGKEPQVELQFVAPAGSSITTVDVDIYIWNVGIF